MAKVIVMFSGGLDSVCASHLLKSMGQEVIGLHFVLPFTAGLGIDHFGEKNGGSTHLTPYPGHGALKVPLVAEIEFPWDGLMVS